MRSPLWVTRTTRDARTVEGGRPAPGAFVAGRSRREIDKPGRRPFLLSPSRPGAPSSLGASVLGASGLAGRTFRQETCFRSPRYRPWKQIPCRAQERTTPHLVRSVPANSACRGHERQSPSRPDQTSEGLGLGARRSVAGHPTSARKAGLRLRHRSCMSFRRIFLLSGLGWPMCHEVETASTVAVKTGIASYGRATVSSAPPPSSSRQ